MIRDEVINEYFDWLFHMVTDKHRYARRISYRKLLILLHSTEFRYSIELDGNRATDGIDLRFRFEMESGIPKAASFLDGPCSLFEMMVALSIRCEEHIMDDPDIGNRTGQWFWGMIVNLDLERMTDDRFNRSYTEKRINILLDRKYKRNGEGGLFTIEDCPCDLRDIEIWYQLCWYLDHILQEGV